MKIGLKALQDERLKLTAEINAYFRTMASENLHREQAWKRKREIADAVLYDGTNLDPSSFLEEAQLRGMTGEAFARLILSKPDPIDARELERQRLLLAVESSKTLAELTVIKQQLRG